MCGKLNADETLKYLIGVVKDRLEELYGVLPYGADARFIHGEKTAYVECLEIMQLWDHSAQHGLDGVIEEVYPI